MEVSRSGSTFSPFCAVAEDAEGAPQWDFGLHPSDAAGVCGGMMGGEDVASAEHRWHPGRLLYYNRAELKQSDHR